MVGNGMSGLRGPVACESGADLPPGAVLIASIDADGTPPGTPPSAG